MIFTKMVLCSSLTDSSYLEENKASVRTFSLCFMSLCYLSLICRALCALKEPCVVELFPSDWYKLSTRLEPPNAARSALLLPIGLWHKTVSPGANHWISIIRSPLLRSREGMQGPRDT